MSDDIKDGGPAYPAIKANGKVFMGGMSLRDYFAGQALVGCCASGDLNFYDVQSADSWVKNADLMYRLADAMIAARNAKTGD